MDKAGLIYERMALALDDIDSISKGQKNAQQGFMYRGIDDVYNAMHKIFAKHKIFMVPEVLEKSREERTSKSGGVLAFTSLRMKYTFYTEDGSSVFCTVEGEGMDSGDKSSNKAMAVAHKYALLQTFLIPTAETKDPDAESPEVAPLAVIPAKQKKEFIEQVISALSAGDENHLRELWSEWDADEKTVLWACFNSQQRSSMKEMMK